MAAEQDHVELILLRILGVLLIAVGFALIAQQVRSDSTNPVRLAQSLVSDMRGEATWCERRQVHARVQSLKLPPPLPIKHPPPPPRPPAPPRTPSVPPILSL